MYSIYNDVQANKKKFRAGLEISIVLVLTLKDQQMFMQECVEIQERNQKIGSSPLAN